MKAAFSESCRFASILRKRWTPQIHIMPDVMRELEGLEHLPPGVRCRVTVCRLIRLAGKQSERSTAVEAMDQPGWFAITDFVPAKGW